MSSSKKPLEYPSHAPVTKEIRMEQQNAIDYLTLKERNPKKFMEKFIALIPYRIVFVGLQMNVSPRTEQYALIGVNTKGTVLNFHAPAPKDGKPLSTLNPDEYFNYIYNVCTAKYPEENKPALVAIFEKYKSNPLEAFSIVVRQGDQDTLIKLSDIFTTEFVEAMKKDPADSKVIHAVMIANQEMVEKKNTETPSGKKSKKKATEEEEEEPVKKAKNDTKKRKKVEEEEPIKPAAGKRKKKEEKQNIVIDALDSEEELKFLKAIKSGLAQVFGIQEKDAPLLLQVIRKTVLTLNEK